MDTERQEGVGIPRSAPWATNLVYIRKKRSGPGGAGVEPRALYDGSQKQRPDRHWSCWIGTWNVGSMTGRFLEVCEALHRRGVIVCCLQEVCWKGSGTRRIRNCKFFWEGGSSGTAGVGILVRADWIENVVEVERSSDRMMSICLLVGGKAEGSFMLCTSSGKKSVRKGNVYTGTCRTYPQVC